MKVAHAVDQMYARMLSPQVKKQGERVILKIAIFSYLVHLLLIVLVNKDLIITESKFFKSPIAAIYTPFSFILIYEVYLLIFYLSKSISSYIGKQYEIITLIVIRRIFKDIAHLELSSDWFKISYDLQFTYDVVTSLVLFVLIFLFYLNIKKSMGTIEEKSQDIIESIQRFILLKKTIAILLVPLLVLLALYTLSHWAIESFNDYKSGITELANINNVFFDEFFTVLIVVDVLLLLASFFYSDKFQIIIRNSGFIISTILIKISFSTEGIINNALIIGAVLFGLLILLIHNLFEKKLSDKSFE